MRYLRGWEAFRADPEFTSKLTTGSVLMLLMFVPVLGILASIALIGWNAVALRRAVSGQDTPLPRLDFDTTYLGKLLETGFKGFIAQMLYSLIFVGFYFAFICCLYAGVFGVMGGVAAGASAGGEAGAGIGAVLSLLILGAVCFLFFVLMMVGAAVLQIGVMRAEITDDLSPALQVGETLKMTKMLAKELFVCGIVIYIMQMGMSFVIMFTLFLGMFPCAVIMQVVVTYMRAELYRVYLEKGGEPLPVGPLVVEGGDLPLVGPENARTPPPRQF